MRFLIVFIISLVTLFLLYLSNDSYQQNIEQTSQAKITNNKVDVAFVTLALGPFRPFIVNALWGKVYDARVKMQYNEAELLQKLIVQVQPKIPSVWKYQGWDLIYNISYSFFDKETRYKYITKGIHVLRNEGLVHLPYNEMILQELAQTYYHRIGFSLDDYHMFYKQQMFRDYKKYFDNSSIYEINAIASAKTKEELLEDSKIVSYRDKILAKHKIDILDFSKLIESFSNISLSQDEKEIAEFKQLYGLIYAAYKRYIIEKELNMDVQAIKIVNDNYGPLDWRLYNTHAIYWSSFKAQESSHLRYILENQMKEALMMGNVVDNTKTQEILLLPNVDSRIFTKLNFLYKSGSVQFNNDDSYKSFLKKVGVIFYLRSFMSIGQFSQHENKTKEVVKFYNEYESALVSQKTTGKISYETVALYCFFKYQELAKEKISYAEFIKQGENTIMQESYRNETKALIILLLAKSNYYLEKKEEDKARSLYIESKKLFDLYQKSTRTEAKKFTSWNDIRKSAVLYFRQIVLSEQN